MQGVMTATMESLDSICRDSTDMQYMVVQRKISQNPNA